MSSAEKIMNKKTLLGYPISDILGILLMIVPFIISVAWNDDFKIFGFTIIEHNIKPDMIMALFACAFYLALVVRYGFFKKDTLADIIVSVIRAFLDIWVLSSFLMMCFPKRSDLINTALILAVLFTWLGMRSIAGYGWIISIILGAKNLVSMNKHMGMIGAVYIILIVLSLMLQVSNVANIKDFFLEFNGKSSKGRERIRDNMNAAADDAKQKVTTAANAVKDVIEGDS